MNFKIGIIHYKVAQQVGVHIHVKDISYCFCADRVNFWKRRGFM
jgi:hypothetical protein